MVGSALADIMKSRSAPRCVTDSDEEPEMKDTAIARSDTIATQQARVTRPAPATQYSRRLPKKKQREQKQLRKSHVINAAKEEINNASVRLSAHTHTQLLSELRDVLRAQPARKQSTTKL